MTILVSLLLYEIRASQLSFAGKRLSNFMREITQWINLLLESINLWVNNGIKSFYKHHSYKDDTSTYKGHLVSYLIKKKNNTFRVISSKKYL